MPGKLTKVGAAVLSTGGAVANTGLALHRLGTPVMLLGKIGNDLFGEAVLSIFRRHHPPLTEEMIISNQEATSYTLVINPPGIDRIFLHDPGPNDTFSASDVKLDKLAGVRIFHFGYPPLVRQMYLDGGSQLVAMMHSIKALGITTSLDMSLPDPNSEAGKVDWQALIEAVMPHVDIFCPSIDELLYMLDRPRFASKHSIDVGLLRVLSERLLSLGAAIVMIKLGEQGAYLRTSNDLVRLQALGSGAPAKIENWRDRELYEPCFQANVAGTTGAGDCTIAGLLTGMLKGLSIEDTFTAAVAVGGCSVESADATSGVPHWDEVIARVNAGWRRHPSAIEL